MELEDLQEIYRLRGLIEVDAVARSAPKLGDFDLASLANELEAMSGVGSDTDAFWASHTMFHRMLMAPVLTSRLERMVTELWHAGERYLRIVYLETDVLRIRSPHDRHAPLLEAARSRSTRTMRHAIADHLQLNEREIVTSLRQAMAAAD